MVLYKKLTPSQNNVYKAASSRNCTIIHGAHAVLSCIALQKRDTVKLYYAPRKLTKATRKSMQAMRELLASIPKQKLSVDSLNRLAGTQKHQGIALRCASRTPDVSYMLNMKLNSFLKSAGDDSLEQAPHVCIFILDNVCDYVLGSITRVAAFYRVQSILLASAKNLESCNTSRASCGSIETMHFVDCSHCGAASVIDDFSLKGYTIVPADSMSFSCDPVYRDNGQKLKRNVLLLVADSLDTSIRGKEALFANKPPVNPLQGSSQNMCSAILHQETVRSFSQSASVALALERIFYYLESGVV